LLAASKHSTKIRGEKSTSEKRDLSYDIDFDFLVNLYNEQKGLCAYSGLPLQFGLTTEKSWVISLERKDSFKGYTKDNVCFICCEFNTSDRSVMLKEESTTGSSAWNKDKFKVFLAFARHKFGYISDEELQDTIDDFKEDLFINQDVVPKVELFTRKPRNKNVVYRYLKPRKPVPLDRYRDYNDIVLITSPSGKQFIGHCPITASYRDRSIERIIDLMYNRYNRKTACERLVAEYEKNKESWSVEVILVSHNSSIQEHEDDLISEYDTLYPNGLNNPSSGRFQSIETRKKISKTLVDKTKRVGHDGRELPKYVKFLDWEDRKGYSITYHPRLRKKDFVSKKKTLDQLYDECIQHLRSLEV